MTTLRTVMVSLCCLGLAACAPYSQVSSGHGNGITGKQSTGASSGGGLQTTTLGAAGQSGSNARTQASRHEPHPTIYFAFDKSHIRTEYVPELQKEASYLNNHPALHVQLEGNTDDRGTREYNLALGQRRAQAVERMLELDGVSKSQLTAVSYGEENSVCTQNTKPCWAKNRRVNFKYTG